MTTVTRKAPSMTREPAEPLRLDYLIKARAIHSMTGATYRSVGLRGAEIVAVSAEPDALDDLAGASTIVTDAPDLTVLPAFSDSHEHLMEVSRNTLLLPVDRARSIAEFLGMVRDAARDAEPEEWVLTSIGWHESNLAENRLPTIAALRAAGVGPDTPNPRGGTIGRLRDGALSGVLEGRSVYDVAAFAPSPKRT